MNQTDNE
ncbi:Protein of unknown function [Bacillus mycoides]|nr:Protein of unknown function [Bacillus mycoides]